VLSLSDLAELADQYSGALESRVNEFAVGSGKLRFNSCKAIMGVINLSADSWYRESVCLNEEAAFERLDLLRLQGADIVDIGAESTLPDANRVDGKQQLAKLLPIIRAAKRRKIPASIETYLPAVARQSLEAGAAVINLTSGANNARIFKHVAEHNAAVILCYVQGKNVREVDEIKFGADPISVMHEYFSRQIELATKAGVQKIFIDPGMGFYYRNLEDSAGRIRHQMKTFLQTFRLRTLGCPVCHALPHAFEHFKEEVQSAEPFFAVLAALGGTDLFRTHEVARTRAVLDTLNVY
jgi:dihydropteroate synthase